MRPQRQQPTRLPRPWDSPGKNTGEGCHFLLQCMKVKSESEVAQSFPTLSNPMDYSLPGSSVYGFSRQEYWSGVPLPSTSEWRSKVRERRSLFLLDSALSSTASSSMSLWPDPLLQRPTRVQVPPGDFGCLAPMTSSSRCVPPSLRCVSGGAGGGGGGFLLLWLITGCLPGSGWLSSSSIAM